MAVLMPDGNQTINGQTHLSLYVRRFDEDEPGSDLDVKCDQFTWSPDGKKIAYSWRLVKLVEEEDPEEAPRKETVESHLIVCDPDSKNAKTILSVKTRERAEGHGLEVHDWR
jgi:hypothetical protein